MLGSVTALSSKAIRDLAMSLSQHSSEQNNGFSKIIICLISYVFLFYLAAGCYRTGRGEEEGSERAVSPEGKCRCLGG